MAGFFSLGSGSGSGRDPTPPHDPPPPGHTNNPTTTASSQGGLLLYRNEEIYQKGFEVWQQYVQVHHLHPHHHPIQQQDHHPFLHPHHHPIQQQDHHPFLHHHHLYPSPSPGLAGPSGSGATSGSRVMMMRQGGGGSSGGGGGSGMNCQDCGNQAKKDCVHLRCRTCCKSRGFDCSTHVKSTWVPAAKRRERHQQQLHALQQQQQQQQQPQQSQQQLEMGMREKRQRENRNIIATTTDPTPRLGGSGSGLEVGQHFPPEVSSPAVFRCVRVHSADDTDEQLAYQTAINIGGHLFKGILYDQGADSHYDTSSGGEPSGVGTLNPHNLLTSSSSAAANNAENQGGSSSTPAPLLDPNALYSPHINAFLAGTQFFPPPRS